MDGKRVKIAPGAVLIHVAQEIQLVEPCTAAASFVRWGKSACQNDCLGIGCLDMSVANLQEARIRRWIDGSVTPFEAEVGFVPYDEVFNLLYVSRGKFGGELGELVERFFGQVVERGTCARARGTRPFRNQPEAGNNTDTLVFRMADDSISLIPHEMVFAGLEVCPGEELHNRSGAHFPD